MRIGFLAWNQFQVAQAAEIAKALAQAEFIFIDRDLAGLKGFDPSWLVPYGAYSRFVSELDLQSLDGQYDAIVAQFRPPLKQPWRKTRLIIQQYSLAKPKTAYNSRWFSADHGLVYGAYSAAIIGQMCPVSQVGNPRFDPVLEGRLDRDVLEKIRSRLDPNKPTVVYQPTWGDLSTDSGFSSALEELTRDFNVVAKLHHMTSIKNAGAEIQGVIDLDSLQVLDLGIYLNEVADIVISDMSGAIFDALYCGKRVVLVGDDGLELEGHKKADPTALEVGDRHRIGPYVSDPSGLRRAVMQMLDKPGLYRSENEQLVEECFKQRGGCAAVAGQAIRESLESGRGQPNAPVLRRYAAPDFNGVLASRAYSSAHKRRATGRPAGARGGGRKVGGRMTGSSFVKNKTFFAAGSHIETWTFASRKDMADSIYQAFNANSAVRFSPDAWKGALARLLSGSHSPDEASGRELLQKMGMLKTVASMYVAEDQPVPDELTASIDALGPLADFFDLAARNELAPGSAQRYIGVDGLIRPMDEVVDEQVVELYFVLSIARELKDEGLRPYRSSQVKFAQNIFEELLHIGVGVYPRIQGGVTGVAPVAANASRVSFTWHTVDRGIPGNLHLKLGSLFGYFVIDDKGYSGWGSPAKLDLASITGGINVGLADQHWRALYANLVEGGKSKYSQLEEDVPDFSDYIFFPMQVFDDTVARLADIDTHSLLKALIEWARNSDLKVVVKRHPMCKSPAIATTLAEGEANGDIFLSGGNIHRLIAGAQCVVTVNSGVGAEALLHLKPVITTGGSDYAPATTRVRTVEQLLSVLTERSWRSASNDEIKQFLYFYTKHYMVECEDREAMSLRLRHLLTVVGGGLPAAPASRRLARIAPNDSEIEFVDPILSLGEKRTIKLKRLYARNFRRVLGRLGRRDLRYWLDGPTLSDFVRKTSAGTGAAPIHIGLLATGRPDLGKVLRTCAKSLGLVLQEKSLDGVPYMATMKRAAGKSASWASPDIVIRYYYEIDGTAWSPQNISLVAKDAEYAKAVYRQSVRQIPAPPGAKLSFMLSNPVPAASIFLDAVGLNSPIRRIQKKRTFGPVGRILGSLFTRRLEIRIPMRFLETTTAPGSGDKLFRMPALLEEYLLRRGGENAAGKGARALALVSDGFCSSLTAAQMGARLRKVKADLDRSRELQELAAEDVPDEAPGSVAGPDVDRGSAG